MVNNHSLKYRTFGVRATAMLWGRKLLAHILILWGLIASSSVLAAVDVNRADVQELQQVKGIGAKTAQRIVLERARGPFESLEHLSERLSGIGPKTIIKLKSAGLCVGTLDKPCAKPQAVSQAKPVRGQSMRADVVTPEILKLP
ncbi:ComEA family DNA-binding protein [Orrella daihaiensis]|uniref:DUF655 domain-containing protein n=1 Tax=Orrella daihaiensis TaxID=2782176 RepID=A0ABY4AK75_9BURK|nr:DUF655 domain-containing protein [Orrella daihaiensis]UOD49805.1 DUF655 domain-containing protein [Orrella daihaiensis]